MASAAVRERRQRVAERWQRGEPRAAVAAAEGVSEAVIKNDVRALGLQRPAGQPPKHPKPEPRQCSECGEWFTPKSRTTPGKQCSKEHRHAALARLNRERRKFPAPTPRTCMYEPCGESFTPAVGRMKYGGGDYCCAKHYHASEQFREHGRAILGERNRRVRQELDELKGKHGWLETAEVMDALVVSGSVTTGYVRRGLLEAELIVLRGQMFYVYRDKGTVAAFKRDWARGGRADGRRERWFDANKVVAAWASRGWLEALMRSRQLSRREAETLVRDRARLRRDRQLRHRRGRRHEATHHEEWASRFPALKAELLERHEHGPNADMERPPSDWNVALALAVEDFESSPDRWKYSPLEPHNEPKAAQRVWEIVKKALLAATN